MGGWQLNHTASRIARIRATLARVRSMKSPPDEFAKESAREHAADNKADGREEMDDVILCFHIDRCVAVNSVWGDHNRW